MNRKLLLGVFALLCAVSFVAFSSAYSYGSYYDDYKYEHTVKESYSDYGYKYTERHVDESPWGKTVTTKLVQDYDTPRSYYISRNRVSDYFDHGYRGYSTRVRHLGYGWDDSWRRDVYDSQYHPYYYQPTWNGNYWAW